MMPLPDPVYNLFNLFYPKICMACGEALGQHEKTICIKCELKIPRTGYCFHHDNPVARVFWGRVNVQEAASFLFFSKHGKVQQLMHNLKYRGQKEVGRRLGFLFGLDLKKSELFNDIDYVIPVPLHPKKLHIRGYNQAHLIAEGLCDSLECDLNTNLKRIIHSSSQTRKSRYERWKNVSGIFRLKKAYKLANKKVLLVDDVLTTGATLESCAAEIINNADGVKLNIGTLAYAQF